MKTGAQLIKEERDRQINEEGYSREHDSEYKSEELIEAAGCYLWSSMACHYPTSTVTFNCGYRPGEGTPDGWPWEDKFWKPIGDPVKDLIKAGALIAAEIDRLNNEPVI